MTNHQLYARILRLWHMGDYSVGYSFTATNRSEMRRIVAEVIYPDRSLVWC